MKNQSTKLNIGDLQKIADATGYSYSTVTKVVNYGLRNNKVIQEAADKLIAENARVAQSIHNQTPKELKEKTTQTIKEIAQKSGYTTHTVRHVLIHKSQKNETIERVARELGFTETSVGNTQQSSPKSSVEKFTNKIQKDFLDTDAIGQSIVSENKYLWAKIAEMEQKQLKYLIELTEPKTSQSQFCSHCHSTKQQTMSVNADSNPVDEMERILAMI